MPSGGTRRSRRSARSMPARRRSTRPRPTSPRSAGRGSTSSPTIPSQALKLLTDAAKQLTVAEAAHVSATVDRAAAGPDRRRSRPALRRRTGRLDAAIHLQGGRRCRADRPVGHGPRARRQSVRHRRCDQGRLPDRAQDAGGDAGRQERDEDQVRRPLRRRASSRSAGQDLLILDSKNTLWRWRPADDTGKGTLTKVILNGAASLGNDIMGIDTFLRPGTQACTTCTSSIRPSSRSGPTRRPPTAAASRASRPTGWRSRGTCRR